MSQHTKDDTTFREIIDDLTENTQTFVKTNVRSVQLEVYERTTNLISSGINAVVMGVLVLFILFFVNIGVAQYIGEQVGRPSFGYLIVAGFYLFLLLIFLVVRRVTKKNNTVKNVILKNVSKTYDDFDTLLADQQKTNQAKEESLTAIQENVAHLKVKVYGEEEEETTEDERIPLLPKPLLTSTFNFIFRRFVFKNKSSFTNKLSPLLVGVLVETVLYSEGKIVDFFSKLKEKVK